MRAVMRAASVLSEMGSLLLVVGVALGVAPGGHYMVTPFPTVTIWRRRSHLHFSRYFPLGILLCLAELAPSGLG